MFLPLGFGNWPRVFPFAILALVLICLGWSFSFFPVVNGVGKDSVLLRAEFFAETARLYDGIISEGCLLKLKDKVRCANPKEKYYLQISRYPDKFPKEAKLATHFTEYNAKYLAFLKERTNLQMKAGLANRVSKSFLTLLRAGFTHSGLSHLFGNLLFLVVFGIWVEQRAGALFTGAVFLAGGFGGILAQLSVADGQYVIGASAGISALMGAFFIFFYKAEFDFVFTLGFLYFKRISMPLLLVFPVFFVVSDFTDALSATHSDVAHLAHIVGLLVGGVVALIYCKLTPKLSGDILYPGEAQWLLRLEESTNPAEIWDSYKNVMKWNVQNYKATESILVKIQNQQLVAIWGKEEALCYKYFSKYLTHRFRKGSSSEIADAVLHFPRQWPLTGFLTLAPLPQILRVADFFAGQEKFRVALPLYQAALVQSKDTNQARVIQAAIQTIQDLQSLNSRKTIGA